MGDASSDSTAVPLDLLLQITDGFSEKRKLGGGSFGEVYLGVHPDGQTIAVKKIYDMPGVDEEQFQNEFKNLARLQHRNIVRLVGYCHHIEEVPAMYEGKLVLAEKIHRALCLEYMSNGSLEKYISDECDKYDWHTGYGIIKGICQGLKYLHTKLEPPIYHLDLKPANILLDENMVPRIADFGISRLFGDERTRATKSTLGTQGYLPPEYIRNYLISSKFDIFSLGVVIIKIMAGRAGYYKSAEMSSHEFINVEDRHKRPTVQNIVDRLNETETECTCVYKKFEVQENSGGLTPNYFMNNGRSVSEVPLNNDAGPSIQARTAWQYPTDMTAQQELGERQAASLPNGIYEPPRQIMVGFPESGGTTTVERQDLAVKVQEAITDPFVVKDHRSALNGKRYPPSKEEAVHRLENISLKGKHCNDLADKNITTVKRLMRHYHRDKSGLQKVPADEMITRAILTDEQSDNFSTIDSLGNCLTGHGQHDASVMQANILNDQGSLLAQPTPFHNFLPVPADEMITRASLTDEQTEYFSTTDSLGNFLTGHGQPDASMTQTNILNDLVSLSAQPTPLHNFLSVPADEMIPRASLTDEQTEYFSTTDSLGINTGDLKQVIIACGKAAAGNGIYETEVLISELRQLVSISGDPMQRLGAYMLQGLVARLSSSGSKLYKSLKCKEPTNSELMSYMHHLCEMCPSYKFGYMSANGAIAEAIKGQNFVHIIDFQIAQGSQWITIIQALAARPRGPPCLRITAIDDSNSAYARGGGLDMVGTRLHSVSASCGMPFEFNAVHAVSHEVYLEHLDIRPGEVIVVNFAYELHHSPDESLSVENHRDRIIRMIKSLSPMVVTLVEQESNTNTTQFFPRYMETLDYYTAMFESIDVALPRDAKIRVNTEQHCLGRDIISLIACEGAERVERHEVFGTWKARFAMAGFRPYPLSSVVNNTIKTLLDGYDSCYRLEERDGVLYLGWKNRVLVVSSAWC
ncbi:DELLA protein GAI-like isoform X2 [Triticum dicoccoides]|uniref:DELLA protein GAI-like isoform X2 n=1 Tax=Triticum dicoccoides TaxID=85692 RepID=UPI0018916084|nr:DELLA protein GAI-like isoform X2 [Triticum dicoccoides]